MVSRRRSRHAGERGTTLFVVVLAITMLTGIGLYTVHSAALLARASGNERQAMQTTYLAQLGVLTTLSQLATNAEYYVRNSRRTKDSSATELLDDCVNNQGLDLSQYKASCAEISSMDTLSLVAGASLFATDSFGTALDPNTTKAPIIGRFHTEMTDVYNGPPIAGADAGGHGGPIMSYAYAKLTTVAELHPAAATNACVQNVMQVAGQHVTRAHVVIGPVSAGGH
jgi:Tfp pilus assembly protein PilX